MPMSVTDERHARELAEAYWHKINSGCGTKHATTIFLAGFEAAHERLSVELEDLRAKYNDRGKVMYDAGDVVRSLYIPQLDQLKKRLKSYETALEEISKDTLDWGNGKVFKSRCAEIACEALARGRGSE